MPWNQPTTRNRWIPVGRIYFFLLTTVNHISVHPEMVDFGSGQGRSDFATAGVVSYAEDCEERERRHGPKDADMGGHELGGAGPLSRTFRENFPESAFGIYHRRPVEPSTMAQTVIERAGLFTVG
jgi:hypothetical protein